MTRENAIYYLQSSGFSEEQINEIEQAFKDEPYEDAISRDEVIDILLNEMECVQRASDDECNRDCGKCDLLRDTDKILQAYRIAIRALEHPEENVVKIIPHGDTISRQAAIDVIENEQKKIMHSDWAIDQAKFSAMSDIRALIADLPSVSTEKTGRWIPDKHPLASPRCSICNGYGYRTDAYCRTCGAKMEGVEE